MFITLLFIVESLEAEEFELRKEIVRARNALFENPSNPPEKKKKCMTQNWVKNS